MAIVSRWRTQLAGAFCALSALCAATPASADTLLDTGTPGGFLGYYGFDVFVGVRDHDGNVTHVGDPVTLKPMDGSLPPSGPTFFLSYREAQSLTNELHRSGFRPDDAAHVNDALAANKEHIADLRKVVFSLLDCFTAPDEKETDR